MPRSKIAGSHFGAFGSYTLAGPPERMIPFGFSSATRVGGDVVADDLAEDVLLAHPPGDELAVLRAEVEDQDEFVWVAVHGNQRVFTAEYTDGHR